VRSAVAASRALAERSAAGQHSAPWSLAFAGPGVVSEAGAF